ncbi:MAG: tRNA (5-methylaminomethyl-2-thiouridine)(34)-methyltransferase MnmD [Flavobacteriales bacterium]|nr:tRNA (5-methylaminomethyl-2-thiouridine)(34)-methyltransferase MnmD [Flavobacteriales bacterium]
MKLNLVVTGDGSHTLYAVDLNEHYHSVNGAIQESQHVFIDAALRYHKKSEVNILEIGFGTGLNAVLSLKETEEFGRVIHYHGIEPFPLERELLDKFNYSSEIGEEKYFDLIHAASWDASEFISENFNLFKDQTTIQTVELSKRYDIVYFDAFAPDIMPELWTIAVFAKIYKAMNLDGVFTTYSCKGVVRRALLEVGFDVEKIPGPPGKREMLRAVKV